MSSDEGVLSGDGTKSTLMEAGQRQKAEFYMMGEGEHLICVA